MTPPPAATAAPRVGGARRLGGRSGSAIPRRVSGPVRARATRATAGGLALPRGIDVRLPRPSLDSLTGAVAGIRGLLGGRGLIVMLAGALLGLVFLQVSLLKLNTQITQNVERAQALERDNATKRTIVAGLDAGRRIQEQAGRQGMTMPAAGSVCYLDAAHGGACSGGDPAAAASAADPVAPGAAATADPAAPAPDPSATTPAAADPGTTADTAPAAQAPAAQPAPAPAPVAQQPAPVSQQPASAPVTQQAAATGGIAAGAAP